MLVTGPIDFLAGVNKLAALVANAQRDPYGGEVFLFRSKRMDRLKLIQFDGSGMILMTKWIEAGKFACPPIQDGMMKLTKAEMTLLLCGMDWRRLEGNPVKGRRSRAENGDYAGVLRGFALQE